MSKQSKEQQTGFWNWGTGLAVVIGLFVVATLSMVFYLTSLDFYLVNDNHYKKAVKYQQQINRIERTRALDTSVNITQSEKDMIRIQFPDTLFRMEPYGMVKLYRPSNSSLDQSFELLLDENGIQTIPTTNLEKGKWTVQVTWKSADEEYFEEAVIFL